MINTTYKKYPKYKPSGIDWLGNVPNGWEIAKFKELFRASNERVRDDSLVELPLSVSGYRGVEPRDIVSMEGQMPSEDVAEYRIVRKGQLAVNTMWLNYTGLGVSEYDGYVSPAYRSYNIKPRIDKRYAHHLLRSPLYVQKYTSLLYGVRPNSLQVKTYDFEHIEILLPHLETQKRIADFLDKRTKIVDELIERKEKLIELLREKRAALITHAVTKGLDPNAKLKPSGISWLGDIPEGWEVWPLKYALIQGSSDGSLIKGRLYSQYSNWLFPAFSASGQDVWVDVFQYDRPGIVLSAVGARCGKTFKANGKWTAIANTHVLFPKKGFERDYLWYMTDNEKFWERGGTAQPFVLVSKTLARKWAFPPFEVQKQITDYLDTETAKIDKAAALIESQIEKLKEYRSSLIYYAVTGKIKI